MSVSHFKILIVLLICLTSLYASAQNRQLQKTDSVLVLIKKHVNNKNAEAIYELTSPPYHKSIALQTFKDVLFKELFSLGEIKKDSLISFVNNETATYKLQFDAVNMQLRISLDQAGKLALFWFSPYNDVLVNKSNSVATSNPLKSTSDKLIDSVARRYIQKSNTAGLSIGIINNGEVSTYNYGETVKDNKRLPTAGTIYEIGSITKTFTATILAWYVKEGKLNLSDPITKYLPDSVANNPFLRNITLLNLSNHTSGLARQPNNLNAQNPYLQSNPYKNYNKQLLFAYLKKCRLNSTPGQKYLYSNLAMGLLGIILEKVSGKPYEQMVSEIISAPLGLKSTVQHLYPLLSTRFATVYDENGKQTPAWDFDALAACGSLRSSLDDLLLYTKANMAKGTGGLSKAFELTQQVTFTGDFKMGLAWHIITLKGVNYYFHNGGTYGSSSYLAFNTDKNMAVIILSNSGESTDVVGNTLLLKLR